MVKIFYYMHDRYEDELPPMSVEWSLREIGKHSIANELPGPSWLDYFATRRQKRNVGLIPDEL